MHRKECFSIKRALAYFTLTTTLLLNSFVPQRSFSARPNSPLAESIQTTLSAKWSGGMCSLNQKTGMVIYESKNKNERAVSFRLSSAGIKENEIGDPIALSKVENQSFLFTMILYFWVEKRTKSISSWLQQR